MLSKTYLMPLLLCGHTSITATAWANHQAKWRTDISSEHMLINRQIMDDTVYSAQRGFTLIELVIVIIITTILAAVVIGLWPGQVANVGAQAELLASDIRYTQMLSMTKGERYRLVITTASNSYQILNSAGAVVAVPSRGATVTLASGITFYSISLPNNLIAFDTTGAPYTDAASPGTALSSLASIALTNGNHIQDRTITISPETGRVTS